MPLSGLDGIPRNKMSAPKGNQFAAKSDREAVRFPVIVRGLEVERKAWRRAAAGGKFNDWARTALNKAANFEPKS